MHSVRSRGLLFRRSDWTLSRQRNRARHVEFVGPMRMPARLLWPVYKLCSVSTQFVLHGRKELQLHGQRDF